MQMSATPALAQTTNSGAIEKRRKIRKGTFSCWECKRRKRRCQFQASSDSACTNCQRTGTQCVSQEIEEPAIDGNCEAERRLTHIEALVAHLERQRDDVQWTDRQPNTQESSSVLEGDNVNGDSLLDRSASIRKRPNDTCRVSRSPVLLQFPLNENRSTRCRMLSEYVESVLPTPATANAIVTQGRSPLAILENPAIISIATSRGVQTHQREHPLKMARSLIYLALCLERLDLNKSQAMEVELEAPTGIVARRYVEAAGHVTCQDALIDSFDSLETLMLQSSFEMSTGNVSNAWLHVRRALNIAQLMQIAGKERQMSSREYLVRLRLVLFDRVLSLMLGLSCETSIDEHWIQIDGLSKSLEQSHAKLSGYLIKRNLRMAKRLQDTNGLDDGYNDYEETRKIDQELKRVMRTLEPLDGTNIPTRKTADAYKYVDQMHHYDLLVLTHLPYLLSGPHLDKSSACSNDFEYSKFVALSASREVLSRFLVCCKSPQIPNISGGLSHKTFISSITLLLAHLLGHAKGFDNAFEHQRPGDLGIVRDIIHEISCLSEAKKGSFDTQVITKLISIENDAAKGNRYVACTVKYPQQLLLTAEDHAIGALQFTLPYFGTIEVLRKRIETSIFSGDGGATFGVDPVAVSFDTIFNPQNPLLINYEAGSWL